MTTAVSSSGALAASTEQNLGFIRGGKITAVNVKVGDRVTAGQVLATEDDAPLRRTLEEQQAQLDAQRAVLTRLVNSPVVAGDADSVEQAQAILSATQDQVKAQKDADDSALNRAEKQLDFDENARDDAQDQLDADQAACSRSLGPGQTATGTASGSVLPAPAAASPMSALGMGGSPMGKDDTEGESDGPAAPTGSTGSTGAGSGTGSFSILTAPVDAAGQAACQRVQSDAAAVQQAKAQVVADRTNRDAAKQRRDVDEAAGQVSIENARNGLVTARNNRNSASSDRPSNIAQQQALVAQQDAAVRQAQQDLDDTVLRAPVDAGGAALTGAGGEYAAAGAATTAQAPGTNAASPGGDASGSGSAQSGTAASATRPGGTQFIVLDSVGTFSVVAPFEQTDATRIAPNQNADVTFDAVPDLVEHGTVLTVAPAATDTSGVISYYVTIVLTGTDPRLRDGLTAQVAVDVDELRDVPAVPNSAVRRENGQTVVTVRGFDGTLRTVPFQAGTVGDTLTQVLSGLTVGDEVVVRT